MTLAILTTKLYSQPLRPKCVARPRLITRLNAGINRRLTLISAPAGFGKTTLISEWLSQIERPSAWLSLDEQDSDSARLLQYMIASLQTVVPNLGQNLLPGLQSPQPPAAELILTAILNDLASHAEPLIFVLDDYHAIANPTSDQIVTFLLNHLPPNLHLVIASRTSPQLPLARLRARGQLTELRAADLRFTLAETTDFLNQVMGLQLAPDHIRTLESRTEGWVAGLQLAALSLQNLPNTDHFIQSFRGSHHFVIDYLAEEVLQRQPAAIQTFLLQTSILERLCAPLCEAILQDSNIAAPTLLAELERANLFIIPLDDQRHWFRYHHLFADLLRQRLPASLAATPAEAEAQINTLHLRASQWFEDNDLPLEAFKHAAAAHAIERAERLIIRGSLPLHSRRAVLTAIDWLASLPTDVLNARPWLWHQHAALLLVNGHTTGVEEKLRAAEAAYHAQWGNAPDLDVIGRIATARATIALTRYQPEIMLEQAQLALDHLNPDNLSSYSTAYWAMGNAYIFQHNFGAARDALMQAIQYGQQARNIFTTILSTIAFGQVQQAENQLHQAAKTFQQVLQITGDQPLQIIGEAHAGLAQIYFEWNDLKQAEHHGQQSLALTRLYDSVIDRFILSEIFIAQLKFAQGDVTGAEVRLAHTAQTTRQPNFAHRRPDVAAAQIPVYLHQGQLASAVKLAETYELPISRAQVALAQGDPSAAVFILERYDEQLAKQHWPAEQLKCSVWLAVALHQSGSTAAALIRLRAALTEAQPQGFIRTFLAAGRPIAELLALLVKQGQMLPYTSQLLAAFSTAPSETAGPPTPPMLEPLSPRELEILHLIADGLSNQEICARLTLALDTVKGHNRRIFGKLQVQRRTEAVARARQFGLI